MSKKPGLFFDSSEEEDPNFLKKNKNVFKDDESDNGTVENEIAAFKKKRQEQLQILAQKDQENEKKLAQLQAQAEATLLGVNTGVLSKKTASATVKTTNTLFSDDNNDDDDEETIKTAEDLLSKARLDQEQNNDITRGVFVPAGAVQWENEDSKEFKKNNQKIRTSELFADDESDAFISSQLNGKKTTDIQTSSSSLPNVAGSSTVTPAVKQQSSLIMSSLFDDDDDNNDDVSEVTLTTKTVVPTAITSITTKETQEKTIISPTTQFSSLFDDDDDDDGDNTPFNPSNTLGDDFDFGAYLSNQK